MSTRAQEISSQFDCDYDTAMRHYSYHEDLERQLGGLGFVQRPRPRIESDHEAVYQDLRAGDYFDGRLPTIIRKLNLDQLSALYSLFSNWYGYVSYQFTLMSARRSEAIRKKEFTWSMVRELRKTDPATGKKRSDQQMSDTARIDIRFVEVSAEYERINAIHVIMGTVVSIAEQDLKTISREVTIKQTEIESQKLKMGISHHIDQARVRNFNRSPQENFSVKTTPKRRI